MKKFLWIFIIAAASLAWKHNDNVEKITTPAQAFVANLGFRTGISIKNATYGSATSIRASRVVNKFKGQTMQDIRFESAGEKYVCRIRIQDAENFFLVGCWDKDQKEIHKKIGQIRANIFARPIFQVEFPTGKAAEFEGPMGVETTKANMRYYIKMDEERNRIRTGTN